MRVYAILHLELNFSVRLFTKVQTNGVQGDVKMKNKIWIPIVILLAVLVIPIPSCVYKDGGTREYTALTYKIVDWNRLNGYTAYDKTRVYFFPYNFKSIDDLWHCEEDNAEHTFIATVLEINGPGVVVEPVAGNAVLNSSDKISFGTADLENIDVTVGSVVKVTYTGAVMESYPVQIKATSWKLYDDLRHTEYTEQWLDKSAAQKYDNNIFDHIKITKIYSNCFFAESVIPMPYEIKLNGTLSSEWCVGDQITATYSNVYYDDENQRVECDFTSVEASDWQPDPNAAYKPVIYLYPEKEIDVSVNLTLDGKLTCTYPAYNNGWTVTAFPDGTLADANGQTYNYLYWEGETYAQYDLSKGFCVKGKDTAAFLENALEKLGHTRREANEFIVYWLPMMEQNEYNIISFQTDIYTDAAKLEVNPAPDTLLRVFQAWKAADSFAEMPVQELTAPERNGFTVVEWGGTEIK